MAWRVTPEEVSGVIRDYDEDISLVPMIIAANALTDVVSSNDSNGLLSNNLLQEIERHLAAHVYDATDHEIASEHTGKSTTQYTGLYGKGFLNGTRHGKLAMGLDITGYLAKLNEGRKKATATWLGKRPSEQVDYIDRY
jgi:hypothetical protein